MCLCVCLCVSVCVCVCLCVSVLVCVCIFLKEVKPVRFVVTFHMTFMIVFHSICRKDFVLLLDTVRTAANDDSKNQLVKVDHCDSVATVLRQWEMPCGTAAEGVRIRFDPCWKNYVQLTSCTWRPFARPLRHQ